MTARIKSIVTASCALLVMTGAATAACGTAALSGTWLAQSYDSPTVHTLQIKKNGKVFEGGNQLGTIKQTEGCKVAFTVSGDVARGWSDFVPPTSSRKPRTIDFGTVDEMLLMIRKP